jgi:Ca2+-binding EF-hand superfamily protein
MRIAKSLLIGASALALAAGYAFADKPANDPGFNVLDKNNDGYLTRTEAAKNPFLAKNFKQADKDGDGKLSRTEYLAAMTKKDLHTAKDKVAGNDKPKNDPGFNALDKDNDGYLTRTEAAANPELLKNFKQADKNGDGKLSRAEYLAVMTKKDLRSAKEKVTGNKADDRNAATGGTKPAK